MGRSKAEYPKRLPLKLKASRIKLNLTQEKMYEALKEEGASLYPGYISLYELGERLPSLLVLLAYSRVSQIPMEYFVDDNLEFPLSDNK